MNLLSLNCRGGGSPRTVRDVATIIQSHSPAMVFLCETRQKAEKMRKYRGRFGLPGFAGKDSEGMSGGLALFWHESLNVLVEDTSERFIDLIVRDAEDVPVWRLTCVYGEPRVEQRHLMWDKMTELNLRHNLP